MKRRTFIAFVAVMPLFAVACSGDDAATSSTTTVAPQVGNPDPPLPMDINSIPYKPGDLAALGDVKIQITTPTTADDGTFSFDVTVTSGALEPFTISPQMFRVYTLDGKSYISVAGPGIKQFGEYTLQSEEIYQGTFSVKIPTDSEPVMFLADLSPIGDRYFPGAWVFDPNFTPSPADG
jgi:hypothetical protein